MLSVARHYLHTKNSFINLVHEADYEYDEHSCIFWKKIAKHVLKFMV